LSSKINLHSVYLVK